MLNSFFSVFVNAVCCWMLFDVVLYVSYVYFVYDIIIIIIIIDILPQQALYCRGKHYRTGLGSTE